MAASVFPLHFHYVKISADVDQPFEELEGVATAPGDQMSQSICVPFFAGGSIKNDGGLRSQFGDEVLDQKRNALNRVAAKGSVETFALCRPSSSTVPVPHAGTYMYLDEMGVLKDLPVNKRATEIAKGCGLDVESPFHGDTFIARVQVEPAPTRNASFRLSELHSGSEFFRSASAENAAYDAAMREYKKAVAEKEVGGGTAERREASAIARGWWHTQTTDEVEVSVALPEGRPGESAPPLRARDLRVDIRPQSLTVSINGASEPPLVQLKLFAAVRPDESTWVVGTGRGKPCVVATMEKVIPQTWPQLQANEGGDAVA
jgi:hypothetical protein